MLLVQSLGVLFDWWERTGAVALLVAPEFLWELLLGHLRGHLGIPAGCAHPLGARTMTSSSEPGARPPADSSLDPPTGGAAAPSSVRRRVCRASGLRLVPQRWQRAGFHRGRPGLDGLGRREPREEPHRCVPGPARRHGVAVLRGNDPKRAGKCSDNSPRLRAAGSRCVCRCRRWRTQLSQRPSCWSPLRPVRVPTWIRW